MNAPMDFTSSLASRELGDGIRMGISQNRGTPFRPLNRIESPSTISETSIIIYIVEQFWLGNDVALADVRHCGSQLAFFGSIWLRRRTLSFLLFQPWP